MSVTWPETEDNIGGYKGNDRVRMFRNASGYDGKNGTVRGLDRDHGWRVWVHPDDTPYGLAVYMDPDDLERIVAEVDLPDATPAPLDPSKVKAGDTVTLERGAPHPAKIEGVVQEVKTYHVFEPKPLRFYIGGHLFSPYDYTLVDHQPAPEPEPEWKPGAVAVATTPTGPDEQVMRTTAYGPLGPVWLDTHSNRLHESEVTDVRPLVVIDPAAVDHLAILDAAAKAWKANSNDLPPSHLGAVVYAAVVALGIEVAR